MRIRSIKPEFWRSDDINAMCIEDRLLFIGLWSYVDDNGVGIDRVSDVCADLFAHDLSVSPHDTLMRTHAGLNRLHEQGVIDRYRVDGKQFLHIVTWDEHQRINRPSPGRYPRPYGENSTPVKAFSEDSLRTHEDSLPGAGEQGNRGAEEQRKTPSSENRTKGADDFDAFWDAYDKKEGRKSAKAKYRIALRKPGVTPERLIEAARSYIAYQRSQDKHPTYTKNPTSWLNGEHWNDERASPMPRQSAGDQRVADALTLAQRLSGEPQTQLRAIGQS